MPKVVDHALRRQEIAAAAVVVLSRDGLAGFTTRRIADEAGVSKGILDHYFDDKAELFIAVLELSHERVVERMRDGAAGLTGVAGLRAAMTETLPLDALRHGEAVAEVSFAAATVSDPGLRRWYRRDRIAIRNQLADRVDAAFAADGLRADTTALERADVLLAFMDSISLQTVIGGPGTSPDEQLAALDRVIAGMVAPVPVDG